MIVTCSGCQKRYNFDESKLAGRKSGTLRCPSCQTTIRVTAPETGDQTTRLSSILSRISRYHFALSQGYP